MSESDGSAEFESSMQLSPWDFDQSNAGWRAVLDAHGDAAAAHCIRRYLVLHEDAMRADPQKCAIAPELLYFHLGQLLAFGGEGGYAQALRAFSRSHLPGRECWNAYVQATVAFLQRDAQEIRASILRIEACPRDQQVDGNIAVVRRFETALAAGQHDYKTAYLREG
ncbi:MAG TPA: hypothetical protein VJP85_10500 [Candidatus Baltobacteraceae bacterium]|nr:hypothetical protein [Candidatus Baltobacteraceae bacterium]